MKQNLCALLALATVGCSSSSEGWRVTVGIRGTESAFAGREILFRAKVEKTAPAPGAAGPGLLGTEVGFGTCSRDRFLSAPIEIEVREGGQTVSRVTLSRVACMLSQTPGYVERNFVFLEDSGDVLAVIDGSDSRVYATCQNVGQPLECAGDEL